MVIFLFTPLKFAIRTRFCNCPQYLCLFGIVVEYTPSIHDLKKMLSTCHIGLIFCFVPANFLSSTSTDKNNPFSRCTNKHSQLETFSQPYFNRIFSNCFSLPKGDHTDFVQKERLGLPYWTMILAICVETRQFHSIPGYFFYQNRLEIRVCRSRI